MIKYLELKKVTQQHEEELQQAVSDVVAGGWYLQGEAIARFEEHYANYIGTKYCVACGNGLDALTLILRAYIELGEMKSGDEVIVPANTYIASIIAITRNGLVPRLVEPDISTLEIDDKKIEEAITDRTRAIMIVHLYGRCAYTEHIGTICKRHNLRLIEDNAQAHGCSFHGNRTGSLGDAAGHSFYPGKNLGAFGDAGAVTTNDERIADIVRALGNYGSSRKYVFPYQGINSRMDEVQAAVLEVKLKYIDIDNACRKRFADYYFKNIHNDNITLSNCKERDDVYHIFPIFSRRRDELKLFLANYGIQTVIHYPIPPHKQDCYKEWNNLSFPITERIHNEELSIPLNQTLTEEEVKSIAATINLFH
jgi:dTDP-4-amino-4,6-dideoxygalactose transaminase